MFELGLKFEYDTVGRKFLMDCDNIKLFSSKTNAPLKFLTRISTGRAAAEQLFTTRRSIDDVCGEDPLSLGISRGSRSRGVGPRPV